MATSKVKKCPNNCVIFEGYGNMLASMANNVYYWICLNKQCKSVLRAISLEDKKLCSNEIENGKAYVEKRWHVLKDKFCISNVNNNNGNDIDIDYDSDNDDDEYAPNNNTIKINKH